MIKLKYKNDALKFKMIFDVDNKTIKLITIKDKIICKNNNEFNWVDCFLKLAIQDIERNIFTDCFILGYGEEDCMIFCKFDKEFVEKVLLESNTLKVILIDDKKEIEKIYKVLKAFRYLISNDTPEFHKPKYSEELKEFVNQAAERNLSFIPY